MQSIKYRYNNDPQVRALIDSLEGSIHNLQFTPSEIRECAMLAAIHYEQRRTRQNYLEENSNSAEVKPVEGAQPEYPEHNNRSDEIALFEECKKNLLVAVTSEDGLDGSVVEDMVPRIELQIAQLRTMR